MCKPFGFRCVLAGTGRGGRGRGSGTRGQRTAGEPKVRYRKSEVRDQELENRKEGRTEDRCRVSGIRGQGAPVKSATSLLNTPCYHSHEFNLAGSSSSKPWLKKTTD
jgi:hypothetical protein